MKKAITAKDLLSNDKLSKEILGQLAQREIASRYKLAKKRETFDEIYKKLTDIDSTTGNKVRVALLYQHLKAFISTYYSDGVDVSFIGREFLDEDYAYMLESMYKYDYKIMKKDKKDFFNMFNTGLYGASVQIKDGYDKVNNVPLYSVVAPSYRMTDTRGNIMNGFRYHMFDIQISKREIDNINKESKTGEIYINSDKYSDARGKNDSKDTKQEARDIGTEDYENLYYDAVRCYVERDGRKYIADVFSNMGVIGRWEEIKPISPEEKKNPSLVPFPVEVTNAFPLEDDPYGIGLGELILCFQNAKNRLLNANIRKEERNAGFQTLLVDISRIDDLDLLKEKPTDGPVFIPYNGELASNTNAPLIQPMMDGIKADGNTMNLANALDLEAQTQSGYTNTSRGVPGEEQTLGEAQMQQQNSNLMFSLDSQCIMWSEVGFVKNIWLRSIKENLEDSKQKATRLGNGLAGNYSIIDGKSIREHNDPDVIVESEKNTNEANRKKLTRMTAREPLVMQDQNVPTISKTFYKREMLRLQGAAREEIFRTYPLGEDEKASLKLVAWLNEIPDDADMNKELPKNAFYPGMDLRTYYIYLQKANAGKAKEIMMNKIDELMKEEGINQMQTAQTDNTAMEGMGNSMASQMTSNAISENTQKNIPSRADVLQG